MRRKLRRSGLRTPGAGLVEYALVLALVALVVVGVLGILGVGTQRGYGLVASVLGARREVPGVLTFGYSPRCGFLPGQGTGLYAEIVTNIPMSDLTVSTDTGFVTLLTPIAGGYKIQPIFDPGDNVGLCPHGLVVQASKAYQGITALAPVEIKSW